MVGADTPTSTTSSSTSTSTIASTSTTVAAVSSTLRASHKAEQLSSPRRDVLMAKMERLEMVVEEKMEGLRGAGDDGDSGRDKDGSDKGGKGDKGGADKGERPAWWVDKSADKPGTPTSPLQKAVSRSLRDVVMVRAIEDCVTKQPGMLSFLAGEVFAVLGKPTKTYWKGQHKGKIGRFPASKVQLMAPAADADDAAAGSPSAASVAAVSLSTVSPTPEMLAQLSPRSRLEAKTMQYFRVRAIADFLPKSGAGMLRFNEGESFCVLSRDSADWWKGQHKGRIGRFPRDHVVEIDEAGSEVVPRPKVGEVQLDGPTPRKLFEDEASGSGRTESASKSEPDKSDSESDSDAPAAAAAVAPLVQKPTVPASLPPPPSKAKASKASKAASPSPADGDSAASPRRSSTPRGTGSSSPRSSSLGIATATAATAAGVTSTSPTSGGGSSSTTSTSTSATANAKTGERGSMAHRRARVAVVEAEKKIASAQVEEEIANRRLQELQTLVGNNDASCVAFKRQIDSLDMEIKSKKVSKRDRERMISVLEGINVEYTQQVTAQTELQRQVNEATARADAARFAGVEARRLFETRTAELLRIQERDERRKSGAITEKPAAAKNDESSESSTTHVDTPLESPISTHRRSSLSISSTPVSDDAPAAAPALVERRSSAWVRAKVPVEPSAVQQVLASNAAAVAAAAGTAPSSVPQLPPQSPPQLPPTPPSTLKVPAEERRSARQ